MPGARTSDMRYGRGALRGATHQPGAEPIHLNKLPHPYQRGSPKRRSPCIDAQAPPLTAGDRLDLVI